MRLWGRLYAVHQTGDVGHMLVKQDLDLHKDELHQGTMVVVGKQQEGEMKKSCIRVLVKVTYRGNDGRKVKEPLNQSDLQRMEMMDSSQKVYGLGRLLRDMPADPTKQVSLPVA